MTAITLPLIKPLHNAGVRNRKQFLAFVVLFFGLGFLHSLGGTWRTAAYLTAALVLLACFAYWLFWRKQPQRSPRPES